MGKILNYQIPLTKFLKITNNNNSLLRKFKILKKNKESKILFTIKNNRIW